MTHVVFVLRSVTHHWRTNLAVVAGVATAVAVLTGALLVGDSVRGSLRDLVLQRLGAVDHALLSTGFFREALVEDLQRQPEFGSAFRAAAPLIVARGVVSEQGSGRRVADVRVYGVDDRFWRLHGLGDAAGPTARDALVGSALARELGVSPGATLLVRVQRPSDVPIDTVHGRRDDVGRTIRSIVRRVLPSDRLGEFSLDAGQRAARTVFLPLARVQQELEVHGRVNALLVAAAPQRRADGRAALERLTRQAATEEDAGLEIRALDGPRALAVEADAGLLDAPREAAVRRALGDASRPIFTYLANTVRSGTREIPYSLVTAIDLRHVAPSLARSHPGDRDPIVLTEWAARDLGVSPGAPIALEFYVWEDPGRLSTRSADFQLAAIVPTGTGDPDLAPRFPGITESSTLGEWDPPFPIDLRRVRPIDEEYWRAYRTTPKAFVPLEVGQRIWGSRHGAATSVRVPVDTGRPLEEARREAAARLQSHLDPFTLALTIRDVRAEGLEASRGATDFGQYFLYFSFFLVLAGVLLAGLFFKLSVDGRAREVGLLRAVGLGPREVRWLFLAEGVLLAMIGCAVGTAAGAGYANLLIAGLRTWWIGAVGTNALHLHVSRDSMAIGAIAGLISAVTCIRIALRGLSRLSERSLLAGNIDAASQTIAPGRRPTPLLGTAGAAVVAAGSLVLAAALGWVDSAGAFFGAGFLLLAACLLFAVVSMRRPARRLIDGRGWAPVRQLGLRNAADRPARSAVTIGVIAAASFIIVSVDAFRRDASHDASDPRSGTGGFTLLVETLLPVAHDPSSREGGEVLGLDAADRVSVMPFRVRPGDDASCLNLYAPRNPRILAPTGAFTEAGRFAFARSLASTEAERANPWRLLDREEPHGAVPVIADANSMKYVLHRELGDEIVIPVAGRDVRLRLVAALRDSIFQGELLMSSANFVALFPEHQGYRFFLAEAVPSEARRVADTLQAALADYGGDATGTADRLAEFHRVENTYLSTFQMLGALGLLLGTVGLAAVVLRNALERRREIALMSALGYNRTDFLVMAIAENTALVAGGLLIGALCALVAIAPTVVERGARLPLPALALLVVAGLVVAALTAAVGALAAARTPTLATLRAE